MMRSIFKLSVYYLLHPGKPDLRHDNNTPLKMQSNIFILAAGFLVCLRVFNTFIVKPLQYRLKSRRLGCGPVPVEPKRWPLGIDVVRRGLHADREQRTPDFVTARFEAMGCYTWGLSLLGTSNLITAEPRNVQALLATQFDDFIMGSARRTNLKTVLGRSIFAVDGKAWHSAREMMRPLFSRENVSRLDLLEQHVQVMLRIIETRDQGCTCESGYTVAVLDHGLGNGAVSGAEHAFPQRNAR
jgi:hypothetical protein